MQMQNTAALDIHQSTLKEKMHPQLFCTCVSYPRNCFVDFYLFFLFYQNSSLSLYLTSDVSRGQLTVVVTLFQRQRSQNNEAELCTFSVNVSIFTC